MNKHSEMKQVLSILCCIIFCSCSNFNGQIEKGDSCTEQYNSTTQTAEKGNIFYVKNTNTHKKLKFTIKNTCTVTNTDTHLNRNSGESQESYDTYTLEPGERQVLGCSVVNKPFYGYCSVKYEVVGEQDVK